MNNYSGICISGNCENGKGVYEFKDGSKYIGNFEDSEFVSNQGDLWLFISDEFKEGEESFYLKAFSGEVEGDYIYIEDMSDFRDVYHPFNAKSVINYVEINCFESSSRPLNAKMYSSSLSQGFVTSTLSEADLIFDFVDFTESERGAVYHELCEILKIHKGDPTKVVYRSMWELRFMKYCDSNENILEWGSEEIVLPYVSPIDNRYHRYFPDFYIKVKERGGKIKKYVIEIKPKKQCIEPKVQKRKTKGYVYEVCEYAKNQAKWKAAKEFCEDRQWEFKVLTEDELGIR